MIAFPLRLLVDGRQADCRIVGIGREACGFASIGRKRPSLKLKEKSGVADIHQNDTVVFDLSFPTQCQRCLGEDLDQSYGLYPAVAASHRRTNFVVSVLQQSRA